MNGQTGKIVGTLPVSKKKSLWITAGITAGLTLVGCLLRFLLM